MSPINTRGIPCISWLRYLNPMHCFRCLVILKSSVETEHLAVYIWITQKLCEQHKRRTLRREFIYDRHPPTML
jgi:hypothetical protein